MPSTLLVLQDLTQTEGPGNPGKRAMERPLPSSSARRLPPAELLDVTGFALLPGGGMGSVERYAQLTLMLLLAAARRSANLRAPVRLWLGGGAPGVGWMRRENWEQRVRALKLGSDAFHRHVALREGVFLGGSGRAPHEHGSTARPGTPLYGPTGAAGELPPGAVRGARLGCAGGLSPQVTLAHLDGTAVAVPDGTLHPDAFASLSLGVENAR